MLIVDLAPSRNANYAPLTVNAPEYLIELGRFIARTVADVEVHAHPGPSGPAELVFHSQGIDEPE